LLLQRFRESSFPRKYLLAARQLLNRSAEVEHQNPEPRRFKDAGDFSAGREGKDRADPGDGSDRFRQINHARRVLNQINETKSIHIITLEDPVEFVHPQRSATFNQREMGTDFDNFASGLRAALRQAPKVILVGEMRDRETVEIGLSAAETGHLVLSTLHTIDAGQTINRILGMFENEEQDQIRLRLADTIRWIVSQRLAPRIGGGRQALLEIMGSNMRTRDSITMGESEGKTFYEIIEASYTFGWRTFDQACLDAYDQGLISEETALLYCTKRGPVTRGIDNIRKRRGESVTGMEGLQLQKEEKKKDPNIPPIPATLKLK